MSARRVIYPAATTPRTVLLVAAPQQQAVYTIRRPIAPADVKPISTLGKRAAAPFEQQHVDILRDSDGESDCDSEESNSYDEIECENDLKKFTVEQDGAPVRKRERLTHLSPEEKMWRRKMKNRIAAQTARDRKKARMDDIEDAVKKLERQNRDLMNENAQLRKQNAELMARMNAFEQKNAQQASVDDQNVSMNTMQSVESAARTGQQRDIGTIDHSTLHICDIDLQRIIDDLLRDAPIEQANTQQCDNAVGDIDTTATQSSSYEYTSIDGSVSPSTSNYSYNTVDDSATISLEELAHDMNNSTDCIQIQDVPHTPPSAMLLLDADLIDIYDDKKSTQENNLLYGGSPVWNEDFSDLFHIVN